VRISEDKELPVSLQGTDFITLPQHASAILFPAQTCHGLTGSDLEGAELEELLTLFSRIYPSGELILDS
jgi:hypothetical protein